MKFLGIERNVFKPNVNVKVSWHHFIALQDYMHLISRYIAVNYTFSPSCKTLIWLCHHLYSKDVHLSIELTSECLHSYTKLPKSTREHPKMRSSYASMDLRLRFAYRRGKRAPKALRLLDWSISRSSSIPSLLPSAPSLRCSVQVLPAKRNHK